MSGCDYDGLDLGIPCLLSVVRHRHPKADFAAGASGGEGDNGNLIGRQPRASDRSPERLNRPEYPVLSTIGGSRAGIAITDASSAELDDAVRRRGCL